MHIAEWYIQGSHTWHMHHQLHPLLRSIPFLLPSLQAEGVPKSIQGLSIGETHQSQRRTASCNPVKEQRKLTNDTTTYEQTDQSHTERRITMLVTDQSSSHQPITGGDPTAGPIRKQEVREHPMDAICGINNVSDRCIDQ